MEALAFYIFGAVALVTALLVVTRTNPIASALWLVVCFFSLAGLYAVLQAHFIAAIQILLYAGAIMVLFVFVIMLLNLGPDELKRRALRFRNVVAGFLVLNLMMLLVVTLLRFPRQSEVPTLGSDFGTLSGVGRLLFDKYLVPFEAASVLLLTAIVGSVVMGKRKL